MINSNVTRKSTPKQRRQQELFRLLGTIERTICTLRILAEDKDVYLTGPAIDTCISNLRQVSNINRYKIEHLEQEFPDAKSSSK